MRFQMESERQSRLYEFFSRENRKLVNGSDTAALDALARLFMKPAQYLVPRHVGLISLLSQVRPGFARLRLTGARSALDAQLALPDRLASLIEADTLDQYDVFALPRSAEDGEEERKPRPSVTVADLRKLWTGLYYTARFAAPREE